MNAPFSEISALQTKKPAQFLEDLRRFDDIRSLCAAALGEGGPDVSPLKSFTIVGGLYLADKVNYPCRKLDRDDFKDISYVGRTGYEETHADTRRLLRLIYYLLRSGVPVDPDFTVHISNFLHREDFLATHYPSDVVLISFVLNEKPGSLRVEQPAGTYDPTDKAQDAAIKLFQDELQDDNYLGARAWAREMAKIVSPLASPECWNQRLSSAKIIASIHHHDEIHLNRLGMDRHAILLGKVHNARVLLGQDIEGSSNSRDNYELAIDKSFARDVGAGVSERTLLGQCLARGMYEILPPRQSFSLRDAIYRLVAGS